MEIQLNVGKLKKGYLLVMDILYGIAALTCFIVNRAAQDRLSWFYVVLAGIALSYCITNLPFMVKTNKVLISAVSASVMTYVLSAVCNWFTDGDWLNSIAIPLISISLVFAWSILLVSCSKHMNGWVKSGIIAVIAGIAAIVMNLIVNYLLDDKVSIRQYFDLTYWNVDTASNKIVFICCMVYAVAAFAYQANQKRKA